jgi:NTE family protein
LNFKQYATEGEAASLSMKYITGRETNKPGTTSPSTVKTARHHGYFLIEAVSSRHINIGKRFTLGTQVSGVFSNKDLFKNYRSTKLTAPGYYPTPHSHSLFIENFHSNNYVAGGIKTIFQIKPALHFRIEGHSFIPIREELAKPDFSVYRSDNYISNYYLQGIAALVYHTGIGPASISMCYYDKPNTNLYFTLNFGYLLFNKRGY